MTPRRATVVVVLFLVSLVGASALAAAQESGKISRVVTIGVIDTGCTPPAKDPCFDTTIIVANPGDNVTIVGNFTNSQTPHNIHVKGVTPEPKTPLAGGEVHTVSFVMPASGAVTFSCDAHATMFGKVLTPAQAAAASAAGEEAVPELGVHFLSYWVGLIAFMLLFVVYGATFFLFKYNETPTTTDHWDRTEGGRRFSPGMASILAILLAVVVIAALIYLAGR